MSGWTVISRTALNPFRCRSAAYRSTSATTARQGIAHAVSATTTSGEPSDQANVRPPGARPSSPRAGPTVGPTENAPDRGSS